MLRIQKSATLFVYPQHRRAVNRFRVSRTVGNCPRLSLEKQVNTRIVHFVVLTHNYHLLSLCLSGIMYSCYFLPPILMEMSQALKMISHLPTAISKNPNGTYSIVGAVPSELCEPYTSGFTTGLKSKVWQTEQEIINALIALGYKKFQLADCSWYEIKQCPCGGNEIPKCKEGDCYVCDKCHGGVIVNHNRCIA